MSGLRVILSDQPIPPAEILQCAFNIRRGVFLYEREAKQPRKLRAVGGDHWLALADHQSRLYHFEWRGLSHRYDASLVAPVAETHYCQIVPSGAIREVFSVTYGPSSSGIVQFHWLTGEETRWVSEGLGIVYGVGKDGELQSVVFEGVRITR